MTMNVMSVTAELPKGMYVHVPEILNIITISATSGSSGFGSAIRSWIDVSTVEMFHAGFQAPCKTLNNHYSTVQFG